MMTKTEEKTPLIYVIGATASGKTSLAIQLAKRLGTEVISADSRYLYKELHIGTAKPSLEEQNEVPHHLIDVASVKNSWSIGEYLKALTPIIETLNHDNKIPILVGGTGQYYRAIVQGWKVPELPPNPELRQAIERWGQEKGFDVLHNLLTLVDPKAAQNIDFRNERRLVRAWEVITKTGCLFSEQRQQVESPYHTLSLGLAWDRKTLYNRIDQRIEAMFEAGLLEEVQSLIEQNLDEAVKRIGVIGYSETLAHLQGEIPLEECKMLIKRHTRQFVRRQANWFKPTDPNIHWFDAKDPASLEKILGLVKETYKPFLNYL